MGYFVYALSRWTARFGALVMLALAFLSVLSIAGRSLSAFGLGPIPGDFELVETGTALAVFCSLPWCFLVRGHAVVDLFWERFPTLAQRAVESVSTILMLLVWLLLVSQHRPRSVISGPGQAGSIAAPRQLNNRWIKKGGTSRSRSLKTKYHHSTVTLLARLRG